MRTLTVAGLLAVLAACGSEPPCDYTGRTYLVAYRELSGDCGELPTSLQQPDGVIPPGCTSKDIPATGSCAIGRIQRCADASDGSVSEATITVHREGDDASYTGLSDITLRERGGSAICHSLYALTLTPQ